MSANTFAKVYATAMATSIDGVRCNGGDPAWMRAHVLHEFLLACFAAGDDPAMLNAAASAAFKARVPVPAGQLGLAMMTPAGSA
jgi:hypothetical protein